MSRITMI